MSAPTLLPARRVTALNDAERSENAIHHDDVARRYGFGGGLVPGVTVYAYMSALPAEHWGAAWVQRGTMTARFVQPVYDGEEIEVRAWVADGGGLALEVCGPDGVVRATGAAGLPPAPTPPPDLAGFAVTGLPEPAARPPASEEVLSTVRLGTFDRRWYAAEQPAFLRSVGEDPGAWPLPSVAHPGWLIRGANDVLSRSVRLGPWMHVSSDTVHHRPVGDGALVSARGRVEALYERKGHRFVELDVVLLADDELVWSIRHVAIYQPRPVAAPG